MRVQTLNRSTHRAGYFPLGDIEAQNFGSARQDLKPTLSAVHIVILESLFVFHEIDDELDESDYRDD